MGKDELRKYVAKYVMKGEFVLSSGKVSNIYIDGRQVTLSSEGLVLVCNEIVDFMLSKGISVIGGLSIGADPIIAGVLALFGVKGRIDVYGLIVRKTAKNYGRMRQVEGPIDKVLGKEILLVDDVATTGGSIIAASSVLRREGMQVRYALVIVDRQEGAAQRLKQEGIELISLFEIGELV